MKKTINWENADSQIKKMFYLIHRHDPNSIRVTKNSLNEVVFHTHKWSRTGASPSDATSSHIHENTFVLGGDGSNRFWGDTVRVLQAPLTGRWLVWSFADILKFCVLLQLYFTFETKSVILYILYILPTKSAEFFVVCDYCCLVNKGLTYREKKNQNTHTHTHTHTQLCVLSRESDIPGFL